MAAPMLAYMVLLRALHGSLCQQAGASTSIVSDFFGLSLLESLDERDTDPTSNVRPRHDYQTFVTQVDANLLAYHAKMTPRLNFDSLMRESLWYVPSLCF